jgi:hypothetical protein
MIVFSGTRDFQAAEEAEAFCKLIGFSVGSSCRGMPQAIMHGEWSVAKWRNLNADERRCSHGTLTGDRRSGPVYLDLLPACPNAAREAVAARVAEMLV